MLAVSIAAYLCAYAALSFTGRYVGENRGGSDNRESWCPAYCTESHLAASGRQRVGFTPVGWVFLPMVILDRWLVHPARFE